MDPSYTPLIILFSAILAAVMAGINIYSSRKTARTKATLDLIVNHQESSYRDELSNEFRKYRDNESGIIALVQDDHSVMEASRAKILEFLNYYEVVCIGFEQDILDQGFYYQHWKTAFIRDYKTALPFILELRKVHKNDKIYENFTVHAEYWSNEKLYISPKQKRKDPVYIAPTILVIGFLFLLWA